jgi:hypothetical protein
LQFVTVKVAGSQFDPDPSVDPATPMSALDLLRILEKFSREKLERIRVQADSTGEFGYMCDVTKRDAFIEFHSDGSGYLKLTGDEMAYIE